jgi:hypothetical protein
LIYSDDGQTIGQNGRVRVNSEGAIKFDQRTACQTYPGGNTSLPVFNGFHYDTNGNCLQINGTDHLLFGACSGRDACIGYVNSQLKTADGHNAGDFLNPDNVPVPTTTSSASGR